MTARDSSYPHNRLMRQVELLLATIESDEGAESVHEIATQVVTHFGEELGLVGGRVYMRDGTDYVLSGTFPEDLEELPDIRVPDSYPPIDQLLQERVIYMRADDPGLDRELESRLGAKEFAALWVGSDVCDCILAFDVVPGSSSTEIRYSLSLLQYSIIHRLREAWLGSVLREARAIQASILPRKRPRYGTFDLAGDSDAVESVGGDFYDYIPITDKILGLAIADVSGHGLPAALQVRDIYMGLRMGLSRDFKIIRTVERLNQIVSRSTLTSRFVSMFYGELELNGTFIYVNAGHNSPFHIAADGEVTPLVSGGPVLGPVPDASYERGFVHLAPGDCLVFYTDGIVETQGPGPDGLEEYGTDRLLAKVAACRSMSSEETIDAIFADVNAFDVGAQQKDDRTVVIVKNPTSVS